MIIGYHASHEQFGPRELLELALEAEDAGFDAVSSSDHIAPWDVKRENVCAAAWPWLGAVLERTRLSATVVTTPGYRYPVPVLAQMIATLAELSPGRFRVALGSGEALNERSSTERWPDKDERDARLRAAATEISTLLETGRTSENRLYLRPEVPPEVAVAAVTAYTAGSVSTWWRSLVTIADTPPATQERIDAFRSGAGEGARIALKAQCSFASTREHAEREAVAQWRNPMLPPEKLAELPTPEAFAAAGEQVSRDTVIEKIRPISSDRELGDWLDELAAFDVAEITLHNVSAHQREFVQALGRLGLDRWR
ncbi:F420-dependent oxidoreductase, G6PDH family [Paramicrobacterium humi]|uniref:F420-dependent oxidoreductase, G6PDH family n=1 Tax=Paramicrobacterium humi TaxID=640635 RepID=A0A1H4IYH4_9MICO|nr:LLM class flavin-dependent oxidoreductase [Microbacterium humi]SEB38418.1 F420-dependent oxidoreductase, G6PDH family [Microbacterium humi]